MTLQCDKTKIRNNTVLWSKQTENYSGTTNVEANNHILLASFFKLF